jgi:hypothetical protein
MKDSCREEHSHLPEGKGAIPARKARKKLPLAEGIAGRNEPRRVAARGETGARGGGQQEVREGRSISPIRGREAPRASLPA